MTRKSRLPPHPALARARLRRAVRATVDAPAPQSLIALAAAIIDHSDDAIISEQLDGTVLSWNAGAEKIFGYAADEMVGEPITRLFPGDREHEEGELIARLLAGNEISHFETRRIRKDGSIVDVSVTLSLVRHTDGAIIAVSKIARDITARRRAADALRESEALLDRAGKLASVGGWSVDLISGVLQWSAQTCLIHEVPVGHVPTVEEAIGYYAPEARGVIERAVRECIEDGRSFDVELPLVTARGRHIWVRSVGDVETNHGKAIRMFGAFQDVTTRHAAESDLAEQHELMRVTLDSIGEAVITTDADGTVKWLNPVAARLTGWQTSEARGAPIEPVFKTVGERTRKFAPHPLLRALAPGAPPVNAEPIVLVSRDGTEYGIEDSAAPIRNVRGDLLGIVLVFHDVSDQRRLANEVQYRASRDALTGLLNRSEFESRLFRTLAAAREDGASHALMFIDLDQFKAVNDACGHAAGDQLLRQVSEIFSSTIRSRDTLARLGGDEFGIIMEHCTAAGARRAGQDLCERVDQYRFMHGDRGYRIGASIGLVPLDGRWTDPEALMQAADESCLRAKEEGRNRVHEWRDSARLTLERQGETRWAARLEEALAARQFRLEGQRIVACRAGPTGFDMQLVVRLTETDGTKIGAEVFMPAAERFGLAARIDRWALAEAMTWLRSPAAARIDGMVLHLSGTSIADKDFHHFTVDLLAGFSGAHRRICIELAETAVTTRPAEARRFIDAVRALGARVGVDGVGAGTASFEYLKTIEVDFLRLDARIVRNMSQVPLDRAAVCHCREVAAVVGAHTIAADVDSPSTLEELARIGIDFAQGPALHPPEPLETLKAVAPP